MSVISKTLKQQNRTILQNNITNTPKKNIQNKKRINKMDKTSKNQMDRKKCFKQQNKN